MKVLMSVFMVLLLSGCWTETPYDRPEMVERAEYACAKLGGVYKYGWDSNYGSVMCFQGREKISVFDVVLPKSAMGYIKQIYRSIK